MNDNRIALTLPADVSWLPLVEDAARRSAKLSEFPPALEDMIAMSVLEACEELLRRSKERNILSEYTVSFDLRTEAVLTEISYDGNIPLNPHLTEDYEVPDSSTGLGDVDLTDLDTLWLHIIKKQMDRVFFQVKGGSHVLKMLKYRRSEGEELRLWALVLAPALKEKLDVEWIERDGHLLGALLSDSDSEKVLRLGPAEACVVRRMDGLTTLYEIYLECVTVVGPFAPQLVVLLFEALEGADMLADPARERKGGKLRALLTTIFNPSFSVPRADAVVTTIYRFVRPLVSPAGAALCLLIGLSGLIPAFETYSVFKSSLVGLEATVWAHPGILIVLYLMILLMVAVHELGHGAVCKHYGGRVPRLGVMFYLTSFIFFCDTTSSWTFPRKGQRIMVSLGGPLTTFAILGVSLWFAAYYAGTGSFWEPVWIMFSVGCFFGLVMNFNPFIRMDAYYMLMDWTGIPNLRQRSFNYLERLIVNLVAKGPAKAAKEPAPQNRVVLLLYALVGSVVTVFFFALPVVWFIRLLLEGSLHKGRIILGIVLTAIALLRLSHSAYMKFQSLRYREYKLV